MVEVNKPAGDGTLPVTLVAGEKASGLASMTARYLEDLLAGSSKKREEAAALHGRLGLHAREGDVQVTIVFGERSISIEEGLRDPDAVISGGIGTLMNVLAGKANPAWKLFRRQLTVRSTLRQLLFGHRILRLMRLPGARPWSGLPPLVVLAAAGTAVAVVVVLLIKCAR